jgi:hypothetical protein
MAAIVVPSVSNYICKERIMMSRTVHDAVQIIREFTHTCGKGRRAVV